MILRVTVDIDLPEHTTVATFIDDLNEVSDVVSWEVLAEADIPPIVYEQNKKS